MALLPAGAGFVFPVDEHNGKILVVFHDVFHRVELLKHRQESEWKFPYLLCLQVKVQMLSFPWKRDGLINISGLGGVGRVCQKAI